MSLVKINQRKIALRKTYGSIKNTLLSKTQNKSSDLDRIKMVPTASHLLSI